MTDDQELHAGQNLQVVRASARLRRNRRRNRRLTVVVSVLTLAFAVGLGALVYAGWRTTLRVTGGREQKVTDPAAPGYTAEAKPTPVELLAVTDGSDHLISLLLFTGGQEGAPVNVVPISPALVAWDFEDASAVPLRDLFAEGGMDVLSLRLGVDLTFAVTSFAEVPFSTFDPILNELGPITVDLADNVYDISPSGDKSIKYNAGQLTLEPKDLPEFLSFPGFTEVELNRAMRARSVWSQILDSFVQSGTSLELPDSVVHGVPLFAELGSARGKSGDAGSAEGVDPVPAEAFKMEMLPTKDVPLYMSPPVILSRVDADSMPSWVTQNVPFPTSAFPGQRFVVSLLNGTKQAGVIRTVAPRVVAAGGAVGLTGNADSFDVEKSLVQYSNDVSKPAADAIAAQFGVSATKVELMPSGIDVTVVVGKDLL